METAKVGKNLQIRRQSLKHSLEAVFAFNVHDGKRVSRTNCDASVPAAQRSAVMKMTSFHLSRSPKWNLNFLDVRDGGG